MTMETVAPGTDPRPAPLVGAMAGAVAIVVFAIVHQIVISNIWFMFGPMVVIGALCGGLIAWVHTRLRSSWWGLNGLYLAALGSLAAISVVAYEPVTTMAEMLVLDGAPGELIGQAMPLTLVFTLVTSVLVTFTFGTWREFPATLATTSMLVATLGLNISIIGLVEFQSGEFRLAMFFFALVALIAATFAVSYVVLMKLMSGVVGRDAGAAPARAIRH